MHGKALIKWEFCFGTMYLIQSKMFCTVEMGKVPVNESSGTVHHLPLTNSALYNGPTALYVIGKADKMIIY